jgi:hypothetical protein
MSMLCGDIQNAVAVCTRVKKYEDGYDLLNKSVNSPDYFGHNTNDTTVRFLSGGK